MQEKYGTSQHNGQDPHQVAQDLTHILEKYFAPFLKILDSHLDKRLVEVCLQMIVAIIQFRNEKFGLKLSELGSYITGYKHERIVATAGTKRIGNFIRSIKWVPALIEEYLFHEAEKKIKELKYQQKRILCIHDDSVIEKP